MPEPEQGAKRGDWVKIHFTGTLENGVVFDASPENEPLEFQIGSEIVLESFENDIIGMVVNEEKVCTVLPEHAYGMRDENACKIFPKSEFPAKLRDAQEGEIITMDSPEGQSFPGKIIKNGSDQIIVDLNHPLAGESLIFKVKLLEISQNPSVL